MSGTAAATVPTYEFDAATTTEIVSCLMFDSDFVRRTEGLVLPEYFENDIERIFVSLAMKHNEVYNEAASATVWKEIFKEACTKGQIRSDQTRDALSKLLECSKLVVRSRPWLMDAIASFAKHQAVINGLITSSVAVFKTADPERFVKAQKIMSDAFGVALATQDEDYDYFERIDERTTERKAIMAGGRPKSGITTGIEELDSLLYHQGWGRKELSAFIGGAKASKSFHIYFCCGRACQAGHNVLIVSLENSVKIVASRLDALMSGVGLSDEFKSPYAMEAGVKAQWHKPGMGILKIRRAPAGTFKPSDLRRMLDEYKTKGIKFDMIGIDYTDLMAPNNFTQSATDNSKSVLVDTRQIADDDDLAILTAFQTNRTGHASAVIKAEQVAEDFNKIRVADIVIGINRTDDEKSEAKARLTFVAARNQPDGYTLWVKQNLNLGLAISEVEKVE